ncbi:ATP synthase subunit e, mitochondrial [Diabrotica virgifera virgifera]|uniref:ATP synthase F(0) complex subunit e, mitochondrial n=1 Tax=Diabrotica virgifera virgifera TaxID=50390 RepID=A0A6P7FQ57_DIAVI|nr:ATP synthase subunit e, mitochondrial [Diabrotica virgifera virgifera]
MSALPAPVRVSPLIKFGRWSFLALGVAYGAFHQNRLSKKEAGIREVENKIKAERDAKLAIEKKAAADKEIKELEALAR